MASLPLIVCDIGDPSFDGMLREPGKNAKAPRRVFNRFDQGKARWIFVEQTGNASRPHRNADLTSHTIEQAIGPVDEAPTAGTFALSYSGNSTGLTALVYNITGDNLETALNANAAVSSDGLVDVVLVGGSSYEVTFRTVGAKSLFVGTPTGLTPDCGVYVTRLVTGTASVNEVQLIQLFQKAIASSSTFTAEAAGTVAVSTIQAGTTTKKEIQRLTISEFAYDGTFIINAATKQKFLIACRANTANKEVTRVLVIAPDVSGSAGGVAFKISNTSNRYLFWVDVNNATTPPTAGDGETLAECDVATNATAQAIAAAIDTRAAALGFTAVTSQISATSWAVDITDAAFGTRTNAVTMNSGFFTVTTTTEGDYGVLQSTGFTAEDSNGSVGVWFNVSSAGTIPPEVAACDRVIAVTGVTANDTAATVGTTLNTALDGDSEFVSTVSSSVLTVVAASAGLRADPADTEDDPTEFTFTTLVSGIQATATVPFNANANEIAKQLNDGFPEESELSFLVVTNGNSWDITFPNFGDQEVMTVDYSGTRFFTTYLSSPSFKTRQALKLFAETSEESLTYPWEVSITPSGEDPITVYRQNHVIFKDVIKNGQAGSIPYDGFLTGSTLAEFLGAITGYTGGGATNLDGVVTAGKSVPRLAMFKHSTDGLRLFVLQAGTDAESSPSIIRPDDYAASTNEKVWVSVL